MTDLRTSIAYALNWCALWGVQIPPRLLVDARLAGIKTEGYYGDVIDRLIADLYNGNMDELEFVQVLESLIDGQLRDAWLEGMAQNGLTEMTPEFELELAGIMQAEHDQVFQFAEAILTQEGQDRLSGENHLDMLKTRGELWKHRYVDIRNQAVRYTANPGTHLVWMLGATEQHCETCMALDNVVATAKEWLESGMRPQNPPNDLLECGGWRCDCRMDVTDAPLTAGGIPKA